MDSVANKDVNRLVQEWLEHDKIVLALDYDDTIYHWRHNSTEDCKRVIELVRWVDTIGAYIMIHTSSDEDRYQEIRDYCKSVNLRIDSINKNPIELPFGREGKPYYNWQLCDRSGLPYAMDVLTKAAMIVLDIKRRNINLTEVG